MKIRCIDWVMNCERSAEMGPPCFHLLFLSPPPYYSEAVIDILVIKKMATFIIDDFQKYFEIKQSYHFFLTFFLTKLYSQKMISEAAMMRATKYISD